MVGRRVKTEFTFREKVNERSETREASGWVKSLRSTGNLVNTPDTEHSL